MLGYASRTGTRRNLDLLRKAGWGLMVSAKGPLRTEGFRYSLDNGAWWSYANKRPFDQRAFLKAFDLLAEGADFAVMPDIVAGGLRSLEFSMLWHHRLEGACPLLLAVQDGMAPADVMDMVGPHLGIFVGGTTQWKERTMSAWGCLAAARQAHLHIGRVNTARRIHLCAAAGADSFDGSSASRYAVELPGLDNARKQLDFRL